MPPWIEAKILFFLRRVLPLSADVMSPSHSMHSGEFAQTNLPNDIQQLCIASTVSRTVSPYVDVAEFSTLTWFFLLYWQAIDIINRNPCGDAQPILSNSGAAACRFWEVVNVFQVRIGLSLHSSMLHCVVLHSVTGFICSLLLCSTNWQDLVLLLLLPFFLCVK